MMTMIVLNHVSVLKPGNRGRDGINSPGSIKHRGSNEVGTMLCFQILLQFASSKSVIFKNILTKLMHIFDVYIHN